MNEQQRIEELERMILAYQKDADESEERAAILRKELYEMEAILAGLVWHKGNDTLELDRARILCNYNSWEDSKVKFQGHGNPDSLDLFYMEDKFADESVEFTVGDARKLINYLQQKLKFLEQ